MSCKEFQQASALQPVEKGCHGNPPLAVSSTASPEPCVAYVALLAAGDEGWGPWHPEGVEAVQLHGKEDRLAALDPGPASAGGLQGIGRQGPSRSQEDGVQW